MSYLELFLLTVVTELLLVAVLAPRGRRATFLGICLAVNAITHPIAFELSARTGPGGIVGIELGVIAVEAIGYRIAGRCGLRRALLVAGLANGITWLMSYLV